MIEKSNIFQKIYEAEPANVVLLTHRNPDGDAIGSTLAMALLFKKAGHKTTVVLPNDSPGFLKWMPGFDLVVVHKHKSAEADRLIRQAHYIISLDYNDISRIDEYRDAYNATGAYKVLVDHHPNPQLDADEVFSDTSVSSTCELVGTLLEPQWIDAEIATCLYTGIMTDTGCFSHNSSQVQTYQVISLLLEKGVDKDAVYDRIYNNFTFDRMRLMGYCLAQKMVHLPEFQTAYISLTADELQAYNYKMGDTEGFVNLPLSIRGVQRSALFIERDNIIKISLRSKGEIAVNTILSDHFQGGGHRNAAGGQSELSMEETIAKFTQLLPAYIT